MGNIVKTIEDEFVLKIYDWGVVEDGTMDETSQKSYTSSLKFMIVTDKVEHYMKQPMWLELFGPYSKCHKANHGFFKL